MGLYSVTVPAQSLWLHPTPKHQHYISGMGFHNLYGCTRFSAFEAFWVETSLTLLTLIPLLFLNRVLSLYILHTKVTAFQHQTCQVPKTLSFDAITSKFPRIHNLLKNQRINIDPWIMTTCFNCSNAISLLEASVSKNLFILIHYNFLCFFSKKGV